MRPGARAGRLLLMLANQPLEEPRSASSSGNSSTRSLFTRLSKRPRLIDDIGHAVGHPRAEVPPRAAEHDDDAGGHVLAAVVPRALDDGDGSRIPHREPVARLPCGEQLACRGAVEDRVADDQMLVRHVGVCRPPERPDDQLAPAQPLAHVVVGLALELEVHPPAGEGAEALSRAPGEPEPH